MNVPPGIDIDSIRNIYILANTPAYLYKELRANASVQRLARTLEVPELFEIYRQAARSKASADEVSLGYAALVAMTLKDYHAVKEVFDRLSAYKLDWAPKIIDLFLSRPNAIQRISADITLDPRNGRQSYLSSASSNRFDVQASKP